MTTAIHTMSALPAVPAGAALGSHIQVIKLELASMESKKTRLITAIAQKRGTLNRLEARSVLNGSAAPARQNASL